MGMSLYRRGKYPWGSEGDRLEANCEAQLTPGQVLMWTHSNTKGLHIRYLLIIIISLKWTALIT